MPLPWNQHHLTLETWIGRELQALLPQTSIPTSGKASIRASSLIHQLFLGTVVRYPELWAVRKRFYALAARKMVEIWKETRHEGDARQVSFACPQDQTEAWVDAVEQLCQSHPWQADVIRLKWLIGMGEVEIAEVLGMSERSVRRQVRQQPLLSAPSTSSLA